MPEITRTSGTQNTESDQNPPTPEISVHLNNSNNIKVGYFGKLGFLHNQAAFAKLFGDKQTFFPQNINTSQDSISTAKSLYSVVENSKLDVFIHIFRNYYVGHESIEN